MCWLGMGSFLGLGLERRTIRTAQNMGCVHGTPSWIIHTKEATNIKDKTNHKDKPKQDKTKTKTKRGKDKITAKTRQDKTK